MYTSARLPAYPLITTDPYLSVWSTADEPASEHTKHWTGARKRLTLTITVDGVEYGLIGKSDNPARLDSRRVSPTCTLYEWTAGGAKASCAFRAPLLPDDLDILSAPVTYVTLTARSHNAGASDARFDFVWHDDICYNGETAIPILGKAYEAGGLSLAYMGKKRQSPLNHSGDSITIDWGYAYLAADKDARFERVGDHTGLCLSREITLGAQDAREEFILAYDDVASIQYFDYTAKAWYARSGKTIVQLICEMAKRRSEIFARLDALDADITSRARKAGGESMVTLACSAYRQSISAHKLIADKNGDIVFLSKENNSNGCIGTADVAYPSIPLYLIYAPELVNAMCRPLLKFAALDVWQYDFAPHDVGRYPYATGQVYGLAERAYERDISGKVENGDVFPPLYTYPGTENPYALRYQMPIEECGNIIIMLAAALRAGEDAALIKANMSTLEKWADYLEKYGADPGEQLCTDDFAGHLARNVNLAFKAAFGLAAWGYILGKIGDAAGAERYARVSRDMALSVRESARAELGTALTLSGEGWSLKYNAVWDKLFGFGILDDGFFEGELARYAQRANKYGVPLDSRSDYTKSDWIMWCAAMTDDAEIVESFASPICAFLADTPDRVPFSDWYFTSTAKQRAFIARSVQGGLFMPLLRQKWDGERA